MAALRDLLLKYDVGVLHDLATECGVESKGMLKNALVGALGRCLSTREHVERALARLTPLEREVVRDIQRGGGDVGVDSLDRLLLKKKLVQKYTPPRDAWDRNRRIGNRNYRAAKPPLEDIAARLLSLGLVFTHYGAEDTASRPVLTWELGHYLVIPPEILVHLPAPVPSEPVAEPARVETGSARNFQRDLSRYAAFVRRSGSLALTTQGWVYKKVMTELLESLGRTDLKKADEKTSPYLFFLRRLLTTLELLSADSAGSSSRPEPSVLYPNEANTFWTRPPAERIRLCYEAYLSTTEWNELRIPAGSTGVDQRHPAPREMVAARQLIVDLLKRRASGWMSLDDLIDDIRLAAPNMLFGRPRRTGYSFAYDYMSPYNSYGNPYGITYRDVGGELEGWDKVEGAIIRHIVAEPLHWMGLMDIGLGEHQAPVAYRLTTVGEWLIRGGAPAGMEEEGGRVVVQPNFQIVALEPLSENVLMALDEFAHFEGGDHALTYRLSRESVYRAQRAGWDAARVIRYLEDETHAPLPQNIRRSLEEWQAQHERITFRRGVALLQAEDAAALDALFADPALAFRLGRRAAGDVALTAVDAHALGAALRDANWSPVLTRPGETSAPGSIVADEAGNVEFVHRTPSIYAYAGIESFAERIDARHARISPASVGAARDRKISVLRILDQLRSVHRGQVPSGLVQRIKAWGKYYGDARMGSLILVEFRDDKARTELLADPELAGLLTRFDAGPRALAVVDAANIERVKQVLSDRGVSVQEFKP